jgi:hypothetical protein
VMKDPRIASMDPKGMPFDVKRMVYGGFNTLVDLGPASALGRGSRRTAREPKRNGHAEVTEPQPAAH